MIIELGKSQPGVFSVKATLQEKETLRRGEDPLDRPIPVILLEKSTLDKFILLKTRLYLVAKIIICFANPK